MSESARGFLFGVTAYFIWGLFPLYWPLLEPASAGEILAHRVVWSAVTTLLLVVLMKRRAQLRALLTDRRVVGWLALASVVISINWLTYIWGVNSGRVVETSLGYFINPLVTVLMAVVIRGERLRRVQWAGIALGALAIGVLTWDYGRLPWVALILAFSFATYGLAKKSADVGAVESMALETAFVAPFALGYLAWLSSVGQSHFTDLGPLHAGLLVSTGLVTAVPLICFGAAAIRVSMVTLGLLQYLGPLLQFLIGVFWYGEAMPTGRWIGFVLIWLALIVFTSESIQHRRKQLALTAEASAL